MINTSPVKMVPSNIEAEQAVLGSIILDPYCLSRVRQIVTAASFYLEKHVWIFEAMLRLDKAGTPIDFLTLVSELERRCKIDDVGGAAYCTAIMNSVPTAINAVSYAELVAELAGKRRMISAASQIAEVAYSDKEYSEAFSTAQGEILKCAPKHEHDTRIESIVADRQMQYNLRDGDPRAVAGVPTGYDGFDATFSGLGIGLHVWQGETHHGKTTFAMNCMLQAAKSNGVKSLMLTLEMSPEQIVDKLVAMEWGYNSVVLATGKINGVKMPSAIIQKRDDAARRIADLDLFIEYCGGATAAELRANIMVHVAEYGVQVAYIDYGQLIAGEGRENRSLELDRAMALMLQTAHECEIPIVVTSQVSRDNNAASHIPKMSRARDSGGLEQNADVFCAVVFEDRHHEFDINYHYDSLITLCGQKDRLFGGGVNKMLGYKIDPATARLTEQSDAATLDILRKRKQ